MKAKPQIHRFAVAFTWLTSLVGPFCAAGALPPEEIFERAAPSVFVVEARRADGRPTQGSAVLVAPGILATNCHTVGIGQSATVRRGRVSQPAETIHRDRWNDVCLLAVANEMRSAAPAQMGSASELRIGAPVYAVGAPRGLELSLSAGIVSQFRRGEDSGQRVPEIQTTAPISPGSSGGGLFDRDGRLVGITTSQLRDGQNLNFAVPVDVVREALTTVGEQRQCLAQPDRACLLQVAAFWILYGDYDHVAGAPGTNLLFNVALAFRREGQRENSDWALRVWQDFGRAGGPLTIDGPLTALHLSTIISVGFLQAGDRATAEANLPSALRTLDEVPPGICASPLLLRAVLELQGRPAMERLARSRTCEARIPRSLRQERAMFLAFLGAKLDAEARTVAVSWLLGAAEHLRSLRTVGELLELSDDARPFLEYAAVLREETLQNAARSFVARYAAIGEQRRRTAPGDAAASELQEHLVRMVALSGDGARARRTALAEQSSPQRRSMLMEVFEVACTFGEASVCSASWLAGEGRHLLGQDEHFSAALWTYGRLARGLAARRDVSGALDAIRDMPRDTGWRIHADRALACVAGHLARNGDLRNAINTLSTVAAVNVRAEFLTGALAPDPGDPRLRYAEVALFERFGLEQQC